MYDNAVVMFAASKIHFERIISTKHTHITFYRTENELILQLFVGRTNETQ